MLINANEVPGSPTTEGTEVSSPRSPVTSEGPATDATSPRDAKLLSSPAGSLDATQADENQATSSSQAEATGSFHAMTTRDAENATPVIHSSASATAPSDISSDEEVNFQLSSRLQQSRFFPTSQINTGNTHKMDNTTVPKATGPGYTSISDLASDLARGRLTTNLSSDVNCRSSGTATMSSNAVPSDSTIGNGNTAAVSAQLNFRRFQPQAPYRPGYFGGVISGTTEPRRFVEPRPFAPFAAQLLQVDRIPRHRELVTPQRQPIGPPAAVQPLLTANVRNAPQQAIMTPPRETRFHPMESRLHRPAIQPTQSHAIRPDAATIARISAGFSPNYRGNIHLERNRSASISAEENCSLFLVGLPPNTTTNMLLAPIRGIGRVYATHINRPEPDKGHYSSAAKIIFFEREAARLFHDAANYNGYIVGGQRARVVYNRIRTAEASDVPRHATRVLIIHGPAKYVNEQFLTEFFESKLEFQIDVVNLVKEDAGGNIVEYRFGSYRCQSQAAKMALAREYPDEIRTWYGEDPCA